MRTRSQSSNKFPQQEASPVIIEPLRIEFPFLEDQSQENPLPEVLMVDNRTMAELLQAPTEGYEDAIVILEITANNFELKHARIWLEKEAPRSIQTWDDLVSKFINQFFPPLKTTNLRNEITRFQQRFDESFYEAWERFNDLLRACPHHGFSELHQLDTFYNALNINDQDSLNSGAGGNFLDKMPRTSSSTPAISSDVAELKDMVKALLLDKKNQSPALTPSTTHALVKAVEQNCVTCGGTHSYQNYPATHENAYRDNIQEYVSQAAAASNNQGNTGFRPQMVANQIRPPGFPPHQNNQNNFNRGNNFNQNEGGNFNQSNFNPSSFNQSQLHRPQVNQAPVYHAPIPQTQRVSQIDFESYVKANDAIMRNIQSQGQSTQNQCQNIQNQNQNLQIQMAALTEMMFKLVNSNTALSSGSGTLPGNTITNPKEDLKGITTRSGVAYQGPKTPSQSKQGTKDISFEISFTDALTLMPKFASTLNALIGNKEKLNEMARTPMNKHCSAVILNKLPRKLGDLGKFLIPCEFPGMDECLALADLGASINLMPFSVWEALSLPKLTPTCMTLELADRSVSKPIGIAKDVSFNTGRALIDVHKVELTLHISPTPNDDPIISTTSPTLTPFGDNDFLLFEEADAFLGLEDDPNSPKINPFYYDLEGDILLLEAILNSEPLPLLPTMNNICLHTRKNSSKLPVIIAKELGDEEKSALIKVLKSHKRAIAWKLSVIQGINLEFCTHKILIEEDYKPAVQHQRRVNPKIHDVIKKEVEKLLDAGLIYLISDSP
nr:hypothetical protein [Tanacetum cinerariifolium]